VSGQTRGDQSGRAVGCDMTLSGEKLGESLEGVLQHQNIVKRKVWTSPLALENHASNRLVEFAALTGCLHALADRKKEALNDLSKIDHTVGLLVSKTLQEVSIGTMKVHDALEAYNCPKDFRRGFFDSMQLNDCCVQGSHRSLACVVFASGERASHDQLIGFFKNPRASKAVLAVVQGLGFRV
jgi:hypothetical protein